MNNVLGSHCNDNTNTFKKSLVISKGKSTKFW